MFFGSLGHGTELTQVFGLCLQQTPGIYTAQKYWTVVRLFVPCYDLQCCKLQLALPRLAARKGSLEAEILQLRAGEGAAHSGLHPLQCHVTFPLLESQLFFPSNNRSTDPHSSEVMSGLEYNTLQSMKHQPR